MKKIENINELTLNQQEIIKLLTTKQSATRNDLRLHGINSRRDLRTLERLGLIKHQEKFAYNQVDEKLRRLQGTRYFVYSLVK